MCARIAQEEENVSQAEHDGKEVEGEQTSGGRDSEDGQEVRQPRLPLYSFPLPLAAMAPLH